MRIQDWLLATNVNYNFLYVTYLENLNKSEQSKLEMYIVIFVITSEPFCSGFRKKKFCNTDHLVNPAKCLDRPYIEHQWCILYMLDYLHRDSNHAAIFKQRFDRY